MNRLSTEHSPYLLQHKDNPVNWFPWSPEAFEVAKKTNKPIFLSIGYSTCHWCHVMEGESFENKQVAEVLNKNFVPIKVDREERPDVDRIYMAFVQATTGSGGWPMSVWLTPHLEPFYGGTYFPPQSQWGRPGFLDILKEITRAWEEEHEKVLQSASEIISRLRARIDNEVESNVPGLESLVAGVAQFSDVFDKQRGGFGDSPKFPRPSELLFLLSEHARTNNEPAREMVLVTLRALALGGIRDHLGGGFHRYTVDGNWRVPHFEKMLYDQAQLTLAYLEAAQLTGDSFYAEVAIETLDYVKHDLADAAGGFYSAEDADSVPSGSNDVKGGVKKEGAFYTWNSKEIDAVLGDDAEIFKLRYGVLVDGNAPSDPQGEFKGENILHVSRSITEIASITNRPITQVERSLESSRAALLVARSSRPRPHLDNKVLTAWNGLMMAAYARAVRILNDSTNDYLEVATGLAEFIRDQCWDSERGVLLRRYRENNVGIEGYAEDYAYLIFGLLELFQATGDPEWLIWAFRLQSEQDNRFLDKEKGGWFSTTGKDPALLLRFKEDYDGAEPAASSVSVLNLMTMACLTGDSSKAEQIDQAFRCFGRQLNELGRSVPMMLRALSTYHAGALQVVISGFSDADDTRLLQAVLKSHYLPNLILVQVEPGKGSQVSRLMPWINAMTVNVGHAVAYVCRDFVCQRPVTDPEEFDRQLATLKGAS